MVGNLPTAVCIGPKFVEPKCNIQSIAQYSTYMYNHIILGEATVFEWNSSTWIWQRGLPSLYASDSCQHLSLNCFMRLLSIGQVILITPWSHSCIIILLHHLTEENALSPECRSSWFECKSSLFNIFSSSGLIPLFAQLRFFAHPLIIILDEK